MHDPRKLSLIYDEMIRLLQGGWIKGYLASDGVYPCSPLSPEAKCFCLRGALERSIYNLEVGAEEESDARAFLYSAIQKKTGDFRVLSSYNDHVACSGSDIVNIILDAKDLMYETLGTGSAPSGEASSNSKSGGTADELPGAEP